MKNKKEKNTNYVETTFTGPAENVQMYDTNTMDPVGESQDVSSTTSTLTSTTVSLETVPLSIYYDPSNTFRAPTYVGTLKIVEGFEIRLLNKPNFIHRWFMRLLLGWKWEDKK